MYRTLPYMIAWTVILMLAVTLCLIETLPVSAAELPVECPAVIVNAKGLTISVDPRIELLAAVQLLSDYRGFDGNPVLTRLEFPYRSDIVSTFEPFKGHPAVTLFKEMSTAGFWYTHPPKAMLYLSNPPGLTVQQPFDNLVVTMAGGSEKLDEFVSALRDFSATSGFITFFDNHRDFYRTIIDEYIALMQRNYVSDIEAYYGGSLAGYTIVLAPLFHPGGYGPRIERSPGVFEAYYLGGPREITVNVPTFGSDDSIRYLCWHEFSHSFVNHLTEDNLASFRDAVEDLDPGTFAQIGTNPADWDIHVADWVSEHIVRGVTSRLAWRYFGEDKGKEMVQHEIGQGFPYVGEVTACFEEYERNRDVYPTLASFYPELIRIFDSLAKDVSNTGQ